MNSLPVLAALPALLAALHRHGNAVLHAPPGAGKSTGVPLALLQQAEITGKILMLEPRRLAARAVAMRMATTLAELVGQRVGYRTRLDTKVSAQTRIEVVTEGILTRMLQRDAALAAVSVVIFDEFHERSLQADLGLALCLEVQANLREDLKLLVMSATLDGAAVARLLGDAPIVTAPGQSFPVTTHYRTVTANKPAYPDLARDISMAIQRAVAQTEGDVLAFLPGQSEIKRTQQLLREAALPATLQVLPLYGELSAAEQDRALQAAPVGQRKIVLATNIAETSLTIEGVSVVIDSGMERRLRFDPITGMNHLALRRISRAAAEQRRGRAGRTRAGVCYRLWPESEQHLLAAHTPAEILESDLLPLALELAAWGQQPEHLQWLDAPPQAHFAQARTLLEWLGALDKQGTITAHGRALAQLGVHPRLAHMMLNATRLQLPALGAELAALLSERDVLRSHTPQRDVDLRSRVEALHGANIAGHEIDLANRQRVQRSAAQLAQQLSAPARSDPAQLHEIGRLLAFAYPDRIAQRRSDGNRYLLSNGRGAYLQAAQTLGQASYLVIAQLDDSQREARIQLAAPVALEELQLDFADRITQHEHIAWDNREQAVNAVRERRLGALVLATQRIEQPDAQQVLDALLTGVRQLGLAALHWTDAAAALRARMVFAQRHDRRTTIPWPEVDDEHLLQELETWLAPWLSGVSRRSQLAQVDIHDALLALLDWPQQQRLNEIAPTHLEVPSGSRIALDYSGAVPTLSVRLQEVFGMLTTPCVGGGEVPVLIELLSPARRPVQLTQDLASFWARGYHDVKKDLKGRYPKHYWPDDPLKAQATARAKPRA